MNKSENIINKYQSLITQRLKSIAGYKTGTLINSINTIYQNKVITISMVYYGQYIPPWTAKTGNWNEPGYIEVYNQTVDELVTDLTNALEFDIANSIGKTININIK